LGFLDLFGHGQQAAPSKARDTTPGPSEGQNMNEKMNFSAKITEIVMVIED